MGAIALGRRLQMTGRALALGVMLALRRVTRETESAIGHEPRDDRLAMTRIARHMRVGGIGVRGLHIDRVTAGAVPKRLVVILMTGGACGHRRGRVERNGNGMTGRAAEVCMGRVREGDGSCARRAIVDHDSHGRRLAVRQLILGVA